MFKLIRITVLLLILFAVAVYTKNQKLTSRAWIKPLEVVIFPMNGDNGNPEVEAYLRSLNDDTFADVNAFFQREGKKYNLLTSEPIVTHLGQVLTEHPPAEPAVNSGMLKIIGWGLKFRYWASQHTPDAKANANKVLVFLYYHQAEKNRALPHSLGLDKGLLTIVHAFASKDQEAQNNIVIAHEILHTVGASDKYDADNQPVFPDGYAQPDKLPLHPQTQAEIMSAKIPVSENRSQMADDLNQCVVGEKTALEINWLKPPQ
jgi:hypothetical protein